MHRLLKGKNRYYTLAILLLLYSVTNSFINNSLYQVLNGLFFMAILVFIVYRSNINY